MPYDARRIFLQGNLITELAENFFLTFAECRVLDLQYNRLGTLGKGVFNGLYALEELELQNNRLVSVDIDAFKRLGSLKYLNLGYNRLPELQSGVFSDLSAVTTLNLQNNKFTEFPEKIFQGLKSIYYLDLRGQILQALPWTVFSPSDFRDGHPAELRLWYYLSDHPSLHCVECLPCDETSCWLKEASAEYGWLQWRETHSGHLPRCKQNQGSSLPWSDFVCEEQGI